MSEECSHIYEVVWSPSRFDENKQFLYNYWVCQKCGHKKKINQDESMYRFHEVIELRRLKP